ncbi:MAG: ATP synthase F1 subunit gamma [Firmicutes bacterium]|nr:ATP synthase F1 subunit gamma [Bacillota bacterium]
MGNMREIRNRIKSVQDTMKITNAMYLISSAKLRKARSSRDDTAPYFNSLKYTISDILERYPAFQEQGLFESEAERNVKDREKNRLFIVISSDKGLAGSYNHNVFSTVEANLNPGYKNRILLVGHMGINYFKKNEDVVVEEEHIYPATTPTVFRAREIAEYVIDQYLNHDIDEVHMVYTKMVNSMTFEPEIMRVLPLARSLFCERENKHLQEPVFSPSPEEVLKHIVPNYVKGIIFGALSESFACEQSARMTAMDNATTNAKEMIRELSLAYNRVRQAAITQEITEVVSGSQSTR